MDTLLQTIESFPPLPESIQQINEICNSDDVDFKAIAKIIESDPILYTDILRYSNVPYHGLNRSVTSISQAISLFGISGIRGMALTAALKAHPHNDLSMYGIGLYEWFHTMEKQQQFLEIWLMKKHRPLLHAMGGLTFILEIGRLVASYALMLTQKAHRFSEGNPMDLGDEEKHVIGYSGDVLASKLFRHWNFDVLFCDTLHNSLSPHMGLDSKSCAALQCARSLYTVKTDEEFENIIPILEEYHFDVDDAMYAYNRGNISRMS